jgi:hypothetical protein
VKRIATAAQAFLAWCNGHILGCWETAWEGRGGPQRNISFLLFLLSLSRLSFIARIHSIVACAGRYVYIDDTFHTIKPVDALMLIL